MNFLGELDAFFARQERLSDEPVFHRVQLSACEHRPAAAPATVVAMATRTCHVTLVCRVVRCTTEPVLISTLHHRADCQVARA